MGVALRVRLFPAGASRSEAPGDTEGGPGGEHLLEVEPATTYGQVLARLGVNPETVVVLRDGAPVPDDGPVAPGEVHVVRVVSGGAGPI